MLKNETLKRVQGDGNGKDKSSLTLLFLRRELKAKDEIASLRSQ
jgi:hypothetical protein